MHTLAQPASQHHLPTAGDQGILILIKLEQGTTFNKARLHGGRNASKEITMLHLARGHHIQDLSLCSPWAMTVQADKATVFVHPAAPGPTISILNKMSSL